MDNKNIDFDIVLIGAGIVGLMTAALLTKQAFRVAIIERHPPSLEWPDDSTDIRVSAVTKGSQKLFEHLGIWRNLCSHGVSSYRHMCVWDEGGPGEIHFDAQDIGQPDLGHIIENRLMQKVLYEYLTSQKTAQFIFSDAPLSYSVEQNGVRLELASGKNIQAKVLIGADGARSWLREKAGIETKGWSYEQKAFVATLTTQEPHQKTAWQRFLPTGPIAFLPLKETNHSSIVWSHTPEAVDALLEQSPEKQKLAIAKALGFRLGDIVSIEQSAAFPLKMQHAERYIAERVVCVGDAIHSIHPLAGQGLNLGLEDAKVLAAELQEAHQKRRDIGSKPVLRSYERARKGPVMGTIALMEAFKRGFQSQHLPIRFLRNQGLQVSNSLSPIKKFFMRQAMGL